MTSRNLKKHIGRRVIAMGCVVKSLDGERGTVTAVVNDCLEVKFDNGRVYCAWPNNLYAPLEE